MFLDLSASSRRTIEKGLRHCLDERFRSERSIAGSPHCPVYESASQGKTSHRRPKRRNLFDFLLFK
jgi:hypothetical protein